MGAGASVDSDVIRVIETSFPNVDSAVKKKLTDLLTSLRNLVNEKRTTGYANVLKELNALSNEHSSIFGHHELHFFSLLKTSLSYCMSDGLSPAYALCILCELSLNYGLKALVTSRDLGLIPIILQMIKNPKDSSQVSNGYAVLANCAIAKVSHSDLLYPDYNVLQFLMDAIQKEPDKSDMYKVFGCLVIETEPENVPIILQCGILKVAMKKLKSYGTDPTKWEKRGSGCCYWCINFIFRISKYSEALPAVRELNEIEFFIALLKTGEIEGIKASFILANVYGRDESAGPGNTKSLLEDRSTILPTIVRLFQFNIVPYDANSDMAKSLNKNGYLWGNIKLPDISSALKNLSISDKNKQIIIKEKDLFIHFGTVMRAFINNDPEYSAKTGAVVQYAGGGGKDVFSIKNILEFLLQMSFLFDDAASMLKSFDNFGKFSLRSLVNEILNLPASRQLTYECRQFALSLQSRYIEKALPVAQMISPAPSVENSRKQEATTSNQEPKQQYTAAPKHIMLSYSWAVKKPLVIAFAKKLRDMGYDVWRDEEGSSLVGPMAGDIVEAMANAIQNSHSVIVCVSPAYKESANCQAEAKYARALHTSTGLRIYYVMMDENYHTRSSPRVVDGWLGFMVGTDLWFPLWNENVLDSSVKSLADQIGKNALLEYNRAFNQHHNPKHQHQSQEEPVQQQFHESKSTHELPKSPHKEVVTKEKDFKAAWALLEPKRSRFPQSFTKLIDEIGLFGEEDLKNIDSNEWRLLQFLLKPAQQTAFANALCLEDIEHSIKVDEKDKDISAAWKFLEAKRSRFPQSFPGLLDEIGVFGEEDLRHLDISDVIFLGLLLKTAQENQFRKVMGIKD